MESMAHPPNICDSRLRSNSGDNSATILRTLTASAMTSGPISSLSYEIQKIPKYVDTNSVARKDDNSKSACKKDEICLKQVIDGRTISGTLIRKVSA